MTVDTDLPREPQSATDAADGRPAGTTAEGCPSPLSWAQVLEEFRSQSVPWTFTTGGVCVRGRSVGTGPALYFLNGMTGTSELFCLLVWLLRDDFRCVVFDYPGAGEGAFRGRLTARRLADLLFACADSGGDETFSLFATSFGSVLALEALSAFPQRIPRAVLQAGFAHRRLSPFERLLVRVGGFLPGVLGDVPYLEAIHRANHERSFPPFDLGRWSFFVENTGRTPLRDLARRAGILGSFDFRRRLPEIRQPVLLIQSEHDGRLANQSHTELARGLPNSTTELLHSIGKLAYLTHPHRLAKLVRTFLVESAGSCVPSTDATFAFKSHSVDNSTPPSRLTLIQHAGQPS
jgi:pimeloyl-ACP methyl ester carboxylesterase